MYLRNLRIIFILFTSTIFLTSCGAILKGKVKKYATVEKGAIPPNFGADSTVLLFATHERSYNKFLKRNIKKAYTGPFLIVSDNTDDTNDISNKSFDTYSMFASKHTTAIVLIPLFMDQVVATLLDKPEHFLFMTD